MVGSGIERDHAVPDAADVLRQHQVHPRLGEDARLVAKLARDLVRVGIA